MATAVGSGSPVFRNDSLASIRGLIVSAGTAPLSSLVSVQLWAETFIEGVNMLLDGHYAGDYAFFLDADTSAAYLFIRVVLTWLQRSLQ